MKTIQPECFANREKMGTTKNYLRAAVPRGLRNWLRAPLRSLEWALQEVKYAAGAKETVAMRPGFSPVCHPAVFNFAYHLQHTDPDQVREFDGFIKYAIPEMVLFDIGAHFGLFSLAALHYGGPRAVAVAVDPSPTAARMVKIQAQLNKVTDRLHVVEASVGDHTGVQNMVAVGVMAGGYFVFPRDDHTGSELTVTKAFTIDDLTDQYQLTPTHIKIDVEGAEAAVLKGGKQTLSGSQAPLLFVELHNQIVSDLGGDPGEAISLLRDYDYKIFSSDGLPLGTDAVLQQEIVRVIASKVGDSGEMTSSRQRTSNPGLPDQIVLGNFPQSNET
jgi:FkbM family methyltransferase